MRIHVLFLLVLLAPAFAGADTVFLKNGVEVEGAIKKETDGEVVIFSDGADWTFARSKIDHITRGPAPVTKALPKSTSGAASAPPGMSVFAGIVGLKSLVDTDEQIPTGNRGAYAPTSYRHRTIAGQAFFRIDEQGENHRFSEALHDSLASDVHVLPKAGVVVMQFNGHRVVPLNGDKAEALLVSRDTHLEFRGAVGKWLLYKNNFQSKENLYAFPSDGSSSEPRKVPRTASAGSIPFYLSNGALLLTGDESLMLITKDLEAESFSLPHCSWPTLRLVDSGKYVATNCHNGPTFVARLTKNGIESPRTIGGKFLVRGYVFSVGDAGVRVTRLNGKAVPVDVTILQGAGFGTLDEQPLIAATDWACMGGSDGRWECDGAAYVSPNGRRFLTIYTHTRVGEGAGPSVGSLDEPDRMVAVAPRNITSQSPKQGTVTWVGDDWVAIIGERIPKQVYIARADGKNDVAGSHVAMEIPVERFIGTIANPPTLGYFTRAPDGPHMTRKAIAFLELGTEPLKGRMKESVVEVGRDEVKYFLPEDNPTPMER